jgi:esterase/lipase superfamily enzyme
MLAAIVLFTGCATTYPLMPAPTMYVGQQAKPLFVDIPADSKKASVDLLYLTDRAPGTETAKTLLYSTDRSRSMAFANWRVVPRPAAGGRNRTMPAWALGG